MGRLFWHTTPHVVSYFSKDPEKVKPWPEWMHECVEVVQDCFQFDGEGYRRMLKARVWSCTALYGVHGGKKWPLPFSWGMYIKDGNHILLRRPVPTTTPLNEREIWGHELVHAGRGDEGATNYHDPGVFISQTEIRCPNGSLLFDHPFFAK